MYIKVVFGQGGGCPLLKEEGGSPRKGNLHCSVDNGSLPLPTEA